ncbi:MAG: alpha/beta hydrolase [Bacteriovoracaceae bacterium]|nr:alpha/beta hydrolase [Bacteriovoracaceae bacterium]
MNAIYFHGGPGFNSMPEKTLLTPDFEQIGLNVIFWNEPSSQRAQGPEFFEVNAYINWLYHAEQTLLSAFDKYGPQVIICHSFGANAAHHLAIKYPHLIKALIYICSCLEPYQADKNLFHFTALDYIEHGDTKSGKTLLERLDKHSDNFDENALQAFLLLLQNPRYINYYWVDKSKMGSYYRLLMNEYQFDLQSFIKVRASFFKTMRTDKINTPTLSIYGTEDIVISRNLEEAVIKKNYSNYIFEVLGECGHYPHYEDTYGFFNVVQRFLASLPANKATAHRASVAPNIGE